MAKDVFFENETEPIIDALLDKYKLEETPEQAAKKMAEEKYFSGGTIKRIFKPYGHVVVKYEEYIIGTALALPEGLKSQFPRSLRTHQVAFKDYNYMDDFN
jgi:hypothetical protein